MSIANKGRILSDLRRDFFKAVSENEYSNSTRYYFEIRFNSLQKYMEENSIKYYSPEIGKDFFQDFFSVRSRKESTKNALRVFISKLNDIYFGTGFAARHSSCEKPQLIGFQDELDDYASFCLENGNKYSTISFKISNCTTFCLYLNQMGCYSFDELNDSLIIQSCLANSGNNFWRCVRQFLMYLYSNGICKKDYSYLVPKITKNEPLPSVYSDSEILQTEQAIDVSTDIGKRDKCIMLLESRLTMRSGDIVKLTFNDLDFNNSRISYIQEKTGNPISLPMLPEISIALKEYIESSRPKSDDIHVFLRSKAPYLPLTTAALRQISIKYIKKADIDPAGRRFGPHSRRASAATSMVNSGVSYGSVKRILGHLDPNAVKHYAALDREHLRNCALPAPPPKGLLKDLLEGKSSL